MITYKKFKQILNRGVVLMLRHLTAGESHGKALTAIIEGLPANMDLDKDKINLELFRRMQGYGRGGRMKIEKDQVEILSGLREGKTIGSPVTLMIKNLDYDNWKDKKIEPLTRPRPGHGDLAGLIKYNQKDIRNILERASARETAIRVAVGAVAKQLLKAFNIEIVSHVISIGQVKLEKKGISYDNLIDADKSEVRCIDEESSEKMIGEIDKAKGDGDSLGGVFEVVALNVPVGLGSHTHWDRKLDGLIAGAFMSIQAIKGVEIGQGFGAAFKRGSEVHDEIFYDKSTSYYRKTNNAGGIEAGISNGCPIVVRAAMKPIPTLCKPLQSIDIVTKKPFFASVERSDVCAVPAASIVGEAVLAWVLAQAITEKFGKDSMEEMLENYTNYKKRQFEPLVTNVKDKKVFSNTDTTDFIKIATLENKFEADLLDTALNELDIPHFIRTYHDVVYDGIFQMQKGWGSVMGKIENKGEILDILLDIRSGHNTIKDDE